MIKRTIEISSGPARLYVRNRQLVVEREGQDTVTVPIEDIGILLVGHYAVSYTHAVLTSLIEAGATMVVCDTNHLPSGLLMPLAANVVQTERISEQLNASLPLKKQLWRATVIAKLHNQATVLNALRADDCGIKALSRKVRSGDPENLEAQAAQRYWRRLFGRSFRRDREGPPPNNLLNYGYTVLRAAMARALCSAGLLPILGIHHHNRSNPFCLADDMVEPYRPLVDWKVATLYKSGSWPLVIGREDKARLLGLLNDQVQLEDCRMPVMHALTRTASSLARSFAERRVLLVFPIGLPETPPDEAKNSDDENEEDIETDQ